MAILKLLAVLALLFLALRLTERFAWHCQVKFHFRPAAPETVCLWQLYAALIYAGWLWVAAAANAHGDVLNGLIVAGLGLFGAGCIVVNNYRRTSLLSAAAATVLQLVVAILFFPPLPFAAIIGDRYVGRGYVRVRIEPW